MYTVAHCFVLKLLFQHFILCENHNKIKQEFIPELVSNIQLLIHLVLMQESFWISNTHKGANYVTVLHIYEYASSVTSYI